MDKIDDNELHKYRARAGRTGEDAPTNDLSDEEWAEHLEECDGCALCEY